MWMPKDSYYKNRAIIGYDGSDYTCEVSSRSPGWKKWKNGLVKGQYDKKQKGGSRMPIPLSSVGAVTMSQSGCNKLAQCTVNCERKNGSMGEQVVTCHRRRGWVVKSECKKM